jgi:hypothetical protein
MDFSPITVLDGAIGIDGAIGDDAVPGVPSVPFSAKGAPNQNMRRQQQNYS